MSEINPLLNQYYILSAEITSNIGRLSKAVSGDNDNF